MQQDRPAEDAPGTNLSAQPPAWWRAVFMTAWLVGLVVSLAVLWRYPRTPGPAGTLHLTWPAASRLASGDSLPTLIMFAHPRCPSTHASLADLRAVIGPFTGRLETIVAFTQPQDAPPDWLESDTWMDAASIPGVRVVADENAREASLFGARTSGQVVLYDARGHLLFSGGLTPARGQAGITDQTRSLAALLESETAGNVAAVSLTRTGGAVYGCPLQVDEP